MTPIKLKVTKNGFKGGSEDNLIDMNDGLASIGGFTAPQLSLNLLFNSAPTTGTTLQNVTRVGARVGVRGMNTLYISPFWKADCTSTHQIRFSYFKFIS